MLHAICIFRSFFASWLFEIFSFLISSSSFPTCFFFFFFFFSFLISWVFHIMKSAWIRCRGSPFFLRQRRRDGGHVRFILLLCGETKMIEERPPSPDGLRARAFRFAFFDNIYCAVTRNIYLSVFMYVFLLFCFLILSFFFLVWLLLEAIYEKKKKDETKTQDTKYIL